ncbi:MAG: FtsW/RodA/SpoVE family cell cycle protein [Oscillospiraceae bacterium]|nr:FtsW/RodA/SpoVE family cell cycle protein [Oscillospiraceae bacterium]
MKSAFRKISVHRKSDGGLTLAVIVCSAISVLMIYSISCNKVIDGVSMNDYRTQLVSAIIGVCISIVLSFIDYRKLAKLWYIYVPVAMGLVLLTFTSLGYRRAGADDQAWLQLGFINLQPSEILKLSFILSFSYHLSRDEENMNELPHMLLLCLHALVPIGIIGIQGDYGTAIIFGCIFASMMISAGISWKYLVTAPILLALAVVFLWNFVLGTVHKKRILILFHPGTDPENLEYQQDLGISALRSGGIFGKGLFNKTEPYISVPEMHNDFMFSYIGQVFGFVGTLGVIILLIYICLKILADSTVTKDSMGKFICMGVFGMILSHCIMNIGMVLKVMPVIGVPLPFLSAGGTAMVSMYTAIGLVLSTYRHNQKKYNMFYDDDE